MPSSAHPRATPPAFALAVAALLLLFLLLIPHGAATATHLPEPPNPPSVEYAPREDNLTISLGVRNHSVLASGAWLVQVYAPWCAHSQKLQAVWPDVVHRLHEYNTTLRYAKVDAAIESGLAALLEIKGYPTVKLISNGNVHTFRDPVSADALILFAAGGWKSQAWYSRLNPTWSFWYKLQLDMFNVLMEGKTSFEARATTSGSSVIMKALFRSILMATFIMYAARACRGTPFANWVVATFRPTRPAQPLQTHVEPMELQPRGDELPPLPDLVEGREEDAPETDAQPAEVQPTEDEHGSQLDQEEVGEDEEFQLDPVVMPRGDEHAPPADLAVEEDEALEQ
ncbi:hypothetical protein BDK51DRAFT_33891, partial [Blyttiomyces helicus]